MKISNPCSAIPMPNRHHIDKSNFNNGVNKPLTKNLTLEISDIYRNTIDDLHSITPFEVPASPNSPGATSILFLPLDCYETAQQFCAGIKKRDHKQVFDSLLRLIGMPANAVCTAGIYINHAITIGMLPKTLLLFIPVLNIVGLIVYAIEEIGELIALQRQYNFSKKFDFNLINILHNLIESPDPLTCDKSLAEVITYLETHAIPLGEKFGKLQLQGLLSSFKELQQKFQDEPYFRRLILQDYLPELKKISGMLLQQNLDKIQKDHLQLNSYEVNAIKKMVQEEYKDKPVAAQRKIVEMALKAHLNLKWVNFARSVNPWFVKEANLKVVTILDELQKNEGEEALHEGFEIMHTMETQNTKRTLTHILGILALLIGAIGLIASFCGCPLAGIIVLSLLGLAFGISRNIVCKGTLDVKGWSFLFDNLFPDFLKKKLFKAPPEEELSEFYKKKKIIPISPTTPSYSPVELTRLYA